MASMTTVLVVDDEPIVRDVVVRYLRREGFDTLEAGDGDSARTLIADGSPELVVLDLMLPGTDGLSLCRWIRSRGDLPVIMLTARGEAADRIVGLEVGADDYVAKPFSARELVMRVKAVLRRVQPRQGSPEPLAYDGLELDPVSRDVVRDGTVLRLTAKEFDLLYFLASNPRQVFSRSQLMESVWGYEAALDTGTLTVHMRRLRAKIEHDPAKPALPRDRVGRRLSVRPVIGFALLVALVTLGGRPRRDHGAADAPDGAAPADRARPARGPAPAPRRSLLRLGDVPHGRRRQDPRRRRGRSVRRRRRRARSRDGDLSEHRTAADRVGPGRGRRPFRPGARGGPRELAELGRSFNEMAASLEGLFDARRELVAAASHDLRTPVASISAMLEAIDDGLAEPEEYIGPLRDQARRLGVLVDDLFELARIDAGALALEIRSVELAPIVESCLSGFEAEARTRNVQLEQRGDTHSRRGALRTRAGRTRPSQPAHERAPPHPVRRHRRSRAHARPPTTFRSRSRTTARASAPRRRSGCSTDSGAVTRPATARARASASPSPAA